MKSNSSRWVLAIALMAVCCGIAAAIDLKGIVRDESGEPLPQATLRLLNVTDSTFVKGTLSNDNGRFNITNVNPGTYLLQTDYVGYGTDYRKINATEGMRRLEPIVLSEKSRELAEVQVVGVKTQVKVMEDTVEFNADSYKVQPNAVVEDLLKRLPGVEVGSDGKITANGKDVTKILVDGKEFFSDDPAVASKNLPADMIDKLQVVDRKSDLARITGVDDGEDETVINLTIKKGMKNGWFGTAEAGYGTDDRYAVSFNVNRFWNDNQITFLGNANNINQMGFTDGNGRRFRRFGGDNGINSTQSFGVNFNVGNQEIFRVGGNVLYSHSDRNSIQTRDRQYLFPDSVSYSYTGRHSRDKGHNIRADFRLQWNPDTLNTFEFRPRFSLNYNHSNSADTTLISAGDANRTRVSNSMNLDDTRGHSFEMGGELIYNHKFGNRPGRSFSIDARYELSNVREKGNSYSFMEFFRNDSIDLYDQFSNNHTWSNMVQSRLSWTEPIGKASNGNFLTFAYRLQYRWNNADKLVYDHPVIFPTEEDILAGVTLPWIDYSQEIFNRDLSNQFRNDYFNQDFRIGFKRVSKIHTIDVGLSLVPQMSKSIDLINADRNIAERWVWNFAPFLRYRIKFNKQRSLNINYNGRSSQPTMAQLQPVADLSDPMKIVIGNPDLAPSFTHNVRLRFQDFNPESQRSIMAMAFLRMTQNSIVSRTTFNSETGGQITTYENVNGIWQAFGMAMFSRPLPNKAFQFTNNINFNYNRNVGFNNGGRNVSNMLRMGESMSLSWRPDNVELEIRPYYNFQYTHNSLKSTASTVVHTYGGSFNATYNAPFGLVLNSELNYTGTAGYAAGFNKNEWLWNMSVAYQFLPGRAATVALKVYDLLQQKSDVSRSVTANYIDDTRFNALTRYFMVTFSYRFNTFGKGNEPGSRNMGPGFGGPMGPPPVEVPDKKLKSGPR